jgi:hypothetical protein
VLAVRVSGKLTRSDYEDLVPETNRMVQQHGKLRLSFEMHDFHGWEVSAAWEDMKFGLTHFTDIERVAMVGEKAWEHGISAFWRPFTTAKLRYFDRSQADEGRKWIRADLPERAESHSPEP